MNSQEEPDGRASRSGGRTTKKPNEGRGSSSGGRKASNVQERSVNHELDFAARLVTPNEWKLRFSMNLDALVRLIGLSRKDAAREMHVSYRLLRRLITAGVSRTDQSNLKSMTRIADFFGLSSVDDLWRVDLARDLMRPKGSNFVRKFRSRLLAERKRREDDDPKRRGELAMLNFALGFENSHVPLLAGPEAEKVSAILASSRAGHFKRVIDDYYELATGTTSDRGVGDGAR